MQNFTIQDFLVLKLQKWDVKIKHEILVHSTYTYFQQMLIILSILI